MAKHTMVSYYGMNYVEHAEKDFIEMKEHGCDTVLLALTEFDLDFWFFLNSCAGTFKDATTHRGGNCAADKAIPPMVVMSLWSHFPLLHSPSTTFGFNAVLSG